MAAVQIIQTEQRNSFSKLQEERVASRCIKPNVVTARAVHVIEKEALGARDHHGAVAWSVFLHQSLLSILGTPHGS